MLVRLALLAAAVLQQPCAHAHTTGVSGFGWLVSGTTEAGPSLEQLPAQVRLAHAAGIRVARFDLSWNITEPQPGVYNFSSYDSWLPAIWDGGLQTMLILDYHNSAYDGFGSPTTPAGVAAFARWCAAAARHFAGRDILWEIYNEPLNFWAAPSGQTPVDPGLVGPKLGSGACLMYVGHGASEPPASWQDPYCQQLFGWWANLAIAASTAIKAVDTQAYVVGPAASIRAWYLDSNQTFLREIFARCAIKRLFCNTISYTKKTETCVCRGVLSHLDAVTVHAYTDGPGSLWDPEEVLPAYAALRDLIDEHAAPNGRNVSIVDGEHGFYTACGKARIETPFSLLEAFPGETCDHLPRQALDKHNGNQLIDKKPFAQGVSKPTVTIGGRGLTQRRNVLLAPRYAVVHTTRMCVRGVSAASRSRQSCWPGRSLSTCWRG